MRKNAYDKVFCVHDRIRFAETGRFTIQVFLVPEIFAPDATTFFRGPHFRPNFLLPGFLTGSASSCCTRRRPCSLVLLPPPLLAASQFLATSLFVICQGMSRVYLFAPFKIWRCSCVSQSSNSILTKMARQSRTSTKRPKKIQPTADNTISFTRRPATPVNGPVNLSLSHELDNSVR